MFQRQSDSAIFAHRPACANRSVGAIYSLASTGQALEESKSGHGQGRIVLHVANYYLLALHICSENEGRPDAILQNVSCQACLVQQKTEVIGR